MIVCCPDGTGTIADRQLQEGSSGGEGIAEFNGIIYAFGDHRQTLAAQRRYVKR